ncbi:MAG: hypothetical protein FWE07_01655 [Turicibacter sp.]|nr:hypothetical protein [Turicibacter sp.]
MEKRDLKKRRTKPRVAFLYGIGLFVATAVFAGVVLYQLWWQPRVATGNPIFGYRMEEMPELNEAWLSATEEFGGNQVHVDYVEVIWMSGPVIYFNIRVEEGISLSEAHSAAVPILEYFIETSNEAALDYSLQVVVSYGEIAYLDGDGNLAGLRADNQREVAAHTHEYHRSFAESTLEYAERYPSRANMTRANDNINSLFTASILAAGGEEELESMRTRFAAITPMTDEEESAFIESQGYIPEYSGVWQVPPTNISDFPNWGVWNNRRSRIDWN